MNKANPTFITHFMNLFKDIFNRFKNRDFYGAFFALNFLSILLIFTSLTFNFLKKDSVPLSFFIGIVIFYTISIIGLIVIEYIERKKSRTFYSRDFLDIDYLNNYQSILVELMDNMRNKTIGIINTEKITFQKDNIRSNIFLPQSYGNDGYIYILKRPESLKIPKNKNHIDDNIIFKPNEGLTGEVFETGISKYTENKDYNLFTKRKDLNSELQWIISFALKVNDTTICVLNIDCIDKNCKNINLNLILDDNDIKTILNQYSEKLSTYQRINIVVSKNN
jgi:hypothetical protein